jgi:hypothetical protein
VSLPNLNPPVGGVVLTIQQLERIMLCGEVGASFDTACWVGAKVESRDIAAQSLLTAIRVWLAGNAEGEIPEREVLQRAVHRGNRGCSPEEVCRELNIESLSYWLTSNDRVVAHAWATEEVRIRAAIHARALRGDTIAAANMLTQRDTLRQRMGVGVTTGQGGLRRRGPRH